jgi:hypothetical protein
VVAWVVREYREEQDLFVVELDEGQLSMLPSVNLRLQDDDGATDLSAVAQAAVAGVSLADAQQR